MIPKPSIARFLLVLSVFVCAVELDAAVDPEPKTTIEIEYSNAVYDFSTEQKKITLQGPITIQTNTLLVTCDHAEIRSSRKGATGAAEDSTLGSIDYILATGNVVITQAGSKAMAGRAEIFPADEKLILEDNPRIVDQHGTVSGYRIVFLQGERKIKIESGEDQERSRINLTDVAEIGFLMGDEPSKPAPYNQ